MTTKGTAVTVVNPDAYAVLSTEGAEMAQVLSDNLDGQGLTSWDLDRVKVPPGGMTMWEVPTADGEDHTTAIDGVIVHSRSLRSCWEQAEATGTPPDCSSTDMVNGSGRYGPGSAENRDGFCELCPMSKFGSGKGGRGQACKEKKELFVVRATDMLPIVVSAPPTSLGAIRKYTIGLATGKFGGRYRTGEVVTRLSLIKEKSAGNQEYGEILPSLVQPLTPEQAARMNAYADGVRAWLSGPALPASAF